MVWGVSEELYTTISTDFGQNVLDTIWHGVHQQQLYAEKFTQLLMLQESEIYIDFVTTK